uniref:Uncharacterized protein n=1 Tax=Arion vulgaris TaxID=1028688 RepID=A0A0B6ZMN6_9EUPU
MSRTAWTVLTSATAFTCGVIYYVHYSQKRDRMQLREGVFSDMERQQKKIQNIHQLELQSDLTKIMKQHRKEGDEKLRLETNNDS